MLILLTKQNFITTNTQNGVKSPILPQEAKKLQSKTVSKHLFDSIKKIPWHYVVAIPCRDSRMEGGSIPVEVPSCPVDFCLTWVFDLKQTTAPSKALSQVNFHHRSHFLICCQVNLYHAKIHNQFYVLLVDRSELSV